MTVTERPVVRRRLGPPATPRGCVVSSARDMRNQPAGDDGSGSSLPEGIAPMADDEQNTSGTVSRSIQKFIDQLRATTERLVDQPRPAGGCHPRRARLCCREPCRRLRSPRSPRASPRSGAASRR